MKPVIDCVWKRKPIDVMSDFNVWSYIAKLGVQGWGFVKDAAHAASMGGLVRIWKELVDTKQPLQITLSVRLYVPLSSKIIVGSRSAYRFTWH